jgi:hypothetical protein
VWFELLWQSGDRSWLQYTTIKHLTAMDAYLENMGVNSIHSLPLGSGTPPRSVRNQVDFPEPIQIPHTSHDDASELQTSSMWVNDDGNYLKGLTKCAHISLSTNILNNIEHIMSPCFGTRNYGVSVDH